MYKIGFDNEKYIELQSSHIRRRIDQFGGKLYLEFGGKLFDDYHASRVLPGFAPDSKVRMLVQLKEEAEIVIVINANDIEKNKVRGDLGITYDYSIPGYPSAIDTIVSDEGYGKNEYIETTRSLVVVTAPGPGSGKMAVCMSQLYHEHKRGIESGYAKFETFPIWNLPLKHPVNIAYEAATADLNDLNMIDPFHLEAYGETAVNYNRDVEIFPVVDAMFRRISGRSPYRSPTDMGVNMAGNCIVDNDAVCDAARMEIVRRYYTALSNQRKENGAGHEVEKLKLIMQSAGVDTEFRRVAAAANAKAEQTGKPATAIELPDGRIVTGKTSRLLGATSAALLNALKIMADIDDRIDLISPEILEPITNLKVGLLGSKNPRMHPDELLIALSICAVHDPIAAKATEQLSKLRYCEMHSSVILSANDEHTLKKLGIHLTCEPAYETKRLYHG